MTDAMTPADIAAMRADALAGTPGDWTSGVYRQRGADLGYVYAAGKSGSVCMDATDVDGRRIARVPLYEATIIADAAIKATQAAEIERLLAGLNQISRHRDYQIPHPRDIARAIIKGTPK